MSALSPTCTWGICSTVELTDGLCGAGACVFAFVGSGYICICLPGDRLDQLAIPMMVHTNEEKHRTAYTVTVDYKHGQYSPPNLSMSRSRAISLPSTPSFTFAHLRVGLPPRT